MSWAVFALLGGGVAGTALADGVHVALTPGNPVVPPGTEFDLRIEVTSAGASFNGYNAVVDYDPAVLTFIERPAATQEGSAMRNACGSTFHSFSAAAGRLTISHVLMCPGLSLTGPATLYVLHFRATTQPRLTAVTFHTIQFANGGPLVPVASMSNATVRVGDPTDASATLPDTELRDLEISPNPAPRSHALRVQWRGSGTTTLTVRDARGRVVQRADVTAEGHAAPSYIWSASTATRAALPSGVYFVTVRNGTQVLTQRVTLVK